MKVKNKFLDRNYHGSHLSILLVAILNLVHFLISQANALQNIKKNEIEKRESEENCY